MFWVSSLPADVSTLSRSAVLAAPSNINIISRKVNISQARTLCNRSITFEGFPR